MKIKIVGLFITIVYIATLFGCKKNSQLEESVPQQNIAYEKVKTWFDIQIKASTNGLIRATNIRSETPLWGKTKYYSENNFFITPIRIGNMNTDQNNSVYKFLLATENSEGTISTGEYFYLFPNKNAGQNFSSQTLQNIGAEFFSLHKIPNNFSGTIIKYDLDYNVKSSKYFEKGQPVSKIEKMVKGKKGKYKDMNDTEENSVVYLPCGQCESYYLVTYDEVTWEIINVEYLYTECGDCPQGEGGGNGGSNECSFTNSQGREILDHLITYQSLYSVMSVRGSEGGPDMNGIIRAPKPIVWQFLQLHVFANYYPKYSAYFSGVVYKTNPTDTWKWDTVTYSYSAKSGGEVPPCFTINVTANVTPVISTNKLNVHIVLSYQSTTSISCLWGLESAVYNGSNLTCDVSSDLVVQGS